MFAATTSLLSAFTLSLRICMLVLAGLSCAKAGPAVSPAAQRTTALISFIGFSLPLLTLVRSSLNLCDRIDYVRLNQRSTTSRCLKSLARISHQVSVQRDWGAEIGQV